MKGVASAIWLLSLFIALNQEAAARTMSRPDEMIVYTIRKGDNLYNLAERHFKHVSYYRDVQKINRISDPYRIPIGIKIKIPVRILRHYRIESEVIAARGQTSVISAKSRRRLAIGDKISEGDRILTGPNSFLTLKLDDETLVNFPSQSITVVRILRKMALSGRVERLFWLEDGRVKASIPTLRQGEKFQIQTPVSISAVRGTEYRATYDKDGQKAGTEVLHGFVNVQNDPDGRVQSVAAGYGIIVRSDRTSAPEPLLSAPRIRSILNGPNGVISLSLEPVSEAAGYRAQIAGDEAFVDIMAEAWSTNGELFIEQRDVDARYVRISAIDRDGLEGLWMTRQLPMPNDEFSFGLTKEGHFGTFNGDTSSFRIQIRRDRPDGQILIDRLGASVEEIGVQGLPSGTYYWSVMNEADPSRRWSPPRRLVITREE